jgi:hypothetical protein
VQRTYPVATLGIEGATSLGAGSAHTCVVTSAGGTPTVVKCWGANGGGALGNGTISTPSYSPVDVVGLSNAIQVTGGGFSSCALLRDASISCWGNNDYGQLGDGTTTVRTTPVPLQVPSVCGDGLVGPSEVCDSDMFSGRTCESFGFGGGAMACRADCSGFDTSACVTASVCGDSIVTTGEVCDSAELGGLTCMDFGYVSGALACGGDCTAFDATNCVGAGSVCGNGVIESGEACDGTNVSGLTCTNFGGSGGILRCTSDCRNYDASGCTAAPSCGDGILNGVESCDGFDFGGDSCVVQGFLGGSLACTASCAIDYSGCSMVSRNLCDPPDALALFIPGTRSGSFTGAEPTDGPRAGSFYRVYAVSLTAGRTYSITMTATGSPLDTFLYLYNGSACSEVALDDDGAGTANDSLLTFTATASGTYYLVATTYNAGATGTYTLTTN